MTSKNLLQELFDAVKIAWGPLELEQASGEAVDQRTNLWNLGVVLYERNGSYSVPFEMQDELCRRQLYGRI